MSCNHTKASEIDIYYICKESWEEEGCEFEGTLEAKTCSCIFDWLVTCPTCGKEKEYER